MSFRGSDEHAAGAAMRRRQRRVHSWLRHKRTTAAMVLAEMTYHTAPKGAEDGQGRGGGERVEPQGEVPEDSSSPAGAHSLHEEEPGGRRPASLAEPPGPQERIQRRTVEQPAELAPMVRCSCAANGGPAGGSAQAFRHPCA